MTIKKFAWVYKCLKLNSLKFKIYIFIWKKIGNLIIFQRQNIMFELLSTYILNKRGIEFRLWKGQTDARRILFDFKSYVGCLP